MVGSEKLHAIDTMLVTMILLVVYLRIPMNHSLLYYLLTCLIVVVRGWVLGNVMGFWWFYLWFLSDDSTCGSYPEGHQSLLDIPVVSPPPEICLTCTSLSNICFLLSCIHRLHDEINNYVVTCYVNIGLWLVFLLPLHSVVVLLRVHTLLLVNRTWINPFLLVVEW